MIEYGTPYLIPFSVLKASLRVQPANGKLKLDLTFDEFVEIVRRLLLTIPIDEEWYRKQYPDVDKAIAAGLYASAKAHFMQNGYFEGRLPCAPVVNEQWYLENNPDVTEAIKRGSFKSAYDHFTRNGYEEGRLPSEP